MEIRGGAWTPLCAAAAILLLAPAAEAQDIERPTQAEAAAPEPVAEAASLVETAADPIHRAADQLFKEKPVRPEEPYLVQKPIIAVAHLNDTVPGLQDKDLFRALDDALYSDIAGLRQTRYRISRLEPIDGGCSLSCAVEQARALGAMYVLWSAIEREGDRMRVVASLASVDNGWSVKDSRSLWVAEIRHLRNGADQVAAETTGHLLGISVRPDDATSVDPVRTMAAYRAKAMKSPEYLDAKAARDAGITFFLLGILVDGAGTGMAVGGSSNGNPGLLVGGIVAEVVGTAMFFAGIGSWAANQVRMGKIEQGIPLSRSLRLDGLAPIIAAGDRGAPGLSARFAF